MQTHELSAAQLRQQGIEALVGVRCCSNLSRLDPRLL